MNSIIVKRRGHEEKFDAKKLYGSVYWACKSSHLQEQFCEQTSEKVLKAVKQWLKKRKKVDSNQIFKCIVKELKKHDKDASFMYETHRDLS